MTHHNHLNNHLNKPTLYAAVTAVVLVIFIGIAFQDVPDNSFHLDDIQNIVNNEATRLQHFSFNGIWQAVIGAYVSGRPLPAMSFAINWLQGNGDPSPFLWTNLFIHTANALLVATFLAILLATQAPGRKTSLWWFAPVLLSTTIWAIHPIQIQAVSYIVQRMASMATFFALLSLLSYIQGRRNTRRTRWGWFLVSAISLAAAFASKQIAAILPFLIIMTEFGICRHGKPLINNKWDYLLLVLPLLLVIYIFADVLSGVGPLAKWAASGYLAQGFDFSMEQRLLTQPRVIFFHLSQVLWPLPGRFSIEHDFPLSTTFLTPPSTIFAISGIFIWVVGGLWLLLRYPSTRIWGFCLLWVPATLAIESSFLYLELVFEHRMYFPLVGLAGLLALALQSAAKYDSKIIAIPFLLTCGFLVMCLIATIQRVPDWKSPITLYESAIQHAPKNPRLWANLGSEYFKTGQFAKSYKVTQSALNLDSDNLQALEIFGSLLLREGRASEAEQYFQHAIDLGDSSDALINQLGFLAVRQGDFPRARKLFLQAAEQMPWNPAYIWNAALALERTGDCTQAWQYWQHYLSLDVSAEEKGQVRNRLQQEFNAPDGRCAGTR